MAVKKTATAEKAEELNLETKVKVRSIAPWVTGFARIGSIGDVVVTPNGFVRLSRAEIINQVQNGNRLFTGTDGNGSHATYYIEDEPTRKEAGFEFNGPQKVFTKQAIQTVFDLADINAFNAALKEAVRTRAEKYALMKTLHEIGVNDYRKIKAAENLTGLPFED